MTKMNDAPNARHFELLDLDEPEEQVATPQPEISPPPDWDPDEPLIIDVNGWIHVRGGRFFTSRVVGRVRGESAEATIAALMNRFQELEERFRGLQRELRASRNLARNLKSAQSFFNWVEGADAIGDFSALLERAHAIVDGLESKLAASREAKLELIQEAEKLSESNSWSAGAKAMDEMMEAWKRAGSGGGDEDDVLWEKFRELRGRFFARRAEHAAALKQSRGAARKAKEDLIARSATLASSTDWQGTFDAMQALMDEWKQSGSAGRKVDDELWEQFRAAREPFFAARREHFDQQRRQAPPRSEPRGRGRAQSARAPGDRGARPVEGGGRTRSTGTLHASLAEILGPMKDLFPGRDGDTGPEKGAGKGKKKR